MSVARHFSCTIAKHHQSAQKTDGDCFTWTLSMDVDALRPGFTYLLLERVDSKKNENRFYYLAWQPSLFDHGAVLRMYGRKDGQRRTLNPLPYPSLADAWPSIRSLIRRRLRNGYRIKEPAGIDELIRTVRKSAPTRIPDTQSIQLSFSSAEDL
jgi:predicted DNA-binding WGR domain protein